METEKHIYTCINCGSKTHELFRKYSPTVLKLSSCASIEFCHKVADKYIEYDQIIVVIDLVLLKREAYRHIIYNASFKAFDFWRLAMILFLMEAYSETLLTATFLSKNLNQTIEIETTQDSILEYKELRFYLVFCKVLLGALTFFTTLFCTCFALKKTFGLYFEDITFLDLLKSLTLASFGKFLLLPALIWGDTKLAEIHLVFVLAYTTLAQLLVFTIICKCSRLWSIFAILIANAARVYVGEIFDKINFF